MKSINHIHAFAIVCLIALAAFRPWGNLNKGLGIRPSADSTAVAYDTVAVDSTLIMQPAQIVLPEMALDTLTQAIRRRDSTKTALADQIKTLDRQIQSTQKVVQKKQQQLIDSKEIEKLLSRQSGIYDESRP